MMKHVIDGIRYNIETCGEGFPLILLHGFTGDANTWLPFCKYWGSKSQLIAIDIIGHGKTDSPAEIDRYRMMSVVDDLFLIMEKLKVEKADVLGYSMGGRLALSFAFKYPKKVRKLILESSSPGLKTIEERKDRVKSDEKLAKFIEEKGIETFTKYWEGIPLFSSQQNLPESIKNSLRIQRLKNSVVGLANSLKGMGTGAQPSWWESLPDLEAETLLITGSLDRKFCRIAEEMKEKIARCDHRIVEGCGHAIHLEDQEKFATIVDGFLSNT